MDKFRSRPCRTGTAVRAWARRLSGDLQLTPWLHRVAEHLSDRSDDDKLRVRCFCFCFANETEARENDDVDEDVILEADGRIDAVESVDENRTRDADVAICMACGKPKFSRRKLSEGSTRMMGVQWQFGKLGVVRAGVYLGCWMGVERESDGGKSGWDRVKSI